jgi:dynein heavy chain 2, cytosolic
MGPVAVSLSFHFLPLLIPTYLYKLFSRICLQILPCQKPLLLKDAQEFEAVIRTPQDARGQPITWSNPAAMRGYLKRLQVKKKKQKSNAFLQYWMMV